jgi:hypothetical protein
MADGPRRPGLKEYFKHAFLYRWNLLFFLGGLGAAAISPWPDAMLPLVMGAELAYLTGLTAMPRFRVAVDAKLAAEAREKPSKVAPNVQQSLERTIEKLPPPALRRFLAIRQRCFEMREIASGVRGHESSGTAAADDVRTPALDRLLFLFLKLLSTQSGLERFLKSTSERELELRVEDLKQRHTAAQTGQDERVVRSLQDSLADAELRLDNYRKSKKDSEFVAIELDRIETKIQALVEMAVSRQDPDTLSHQVTAAAESMQQTEEAVNQLQHLTGLADQLEDTPPILEANIGQIFAKER